MKIKRELLKFDMNTENVKNNIVDFIEQFCYIKVKKTNIYRPIKLSNLQKKFIERLNKNTLPHRGSVFLLFSGRHRVPTV